ncbi:hypothetical protein [Streptomyces sp. SID13588]|uniref:hypothetical protein n=1 Tax=Streptomyces sp. SID13588 TaxID=2706051 RepID=UPI0013C648E1|nr:hypothetical protein [Streptomyces sp. SID13588]NEA72404.1 hypothetical protein [Streptomyces sp. SID13588]
MGAHELQVRLDVGGKDRCPPGDGCDPRPDEGHGGGRRLVDHRPHTELLSAAAGPLPGVFE